MRWKRKLKTIREQLPDDIDDDRGRGPVGLHPPRHRDVKLDAVIGGLLSILIIFLFLRDGWSTFVISLSLPVSIIATFFFMGQFGLSLNVMSLGGLALATGLVVDDSIVVLESIAKARERGLGILEAAIVGTREVGMAVVASTLTTIAVFLPLVFVQGIAGQLFRDQALTVAIAIAVSLVVAMTLIPMLSALKGRPPLGFPERRRAGLAAGQVLAEAGGGLPAWHRRDVPLWLLRIAWLVVRLARPGRGGRSGDAQGQRPGDGAVRARRTRLPARSCRMRWRGRGRCSAGAGMPSR
jgi:HAE1 family hydrophobic/amphiphilic exporter-1